MAQQKKWVPWAVGAALGGVSALAWVKMLAPGPSFPPLPDFTQTAGAPSIGTGGAPGGLSPGQASQGAAPGGLFPGQASQGAAPGGLSPGQASQGAAPGGLSPGQASQGHGHNPAEDYLTFRHPFTGNTYAWLVKRLWKLAEGLEPVEMDPLDVPGFYDRVLLGGQQPSIENVIAECARIERADLSYPIIVSPEHQMVMDGAHRLAKAVTHGLKVNVVFLEKTPPPDRIF